MHYQYFENCRLNWTILRLSLLLMVVSLVAKLDKGMVIQADDGSQPEVEVRFPGTVTDWNGFERFDFEVDGKPVLVVAPQTAATGRPWVWHGEFFGHKPAPDIELLKRGFHIVYMRIPNMLGSPAAVAHWDVFYDELTAKYGLAEKAALVGLSRGGLYCYNWAITNPDKVACIYADAAVCDFKSWPGGKGQGKGSPKDWELVLKEYAFGSEQDALSYRHNPVDQLEPLARAGVPLLHVYGDADDVVPWQENTAVVAERYRALGGAITLIAKAGIGHHPHGLEDSTPIVEFVVKHCSPELTSAATAPQTIRVLSYNIHHGEGIDGVLDLQRIASVILSCKPDIVSLQEVDQRVARTERMDQPAELARLTGMDMVFGGNIELQGGHYGNAILSRLPILRHENHLLPCFDNGEQRGVLEAVVQLEGDSELRLLATHFDHRRNDAERQASAFMINKLLAPTNSAPMILAGDLNDSWESPTLEILFKSWTATSHEAQPTIPVALPTRQLDFILFRPQNRWQVITSEVLEEKVASDHRAILGVLELR